MKGLPTVKFTSSDRIVTENAGHITDFLTFDVVPPGEHTAYISFTFSGTATGRAGLQHPEYDADRERKYKQHYHKHHNGQRQRSRARRNRNHHRRSGQRQHPGGPGIQHQNANHPGQRRASDPLLHIRDLQRERERRPRSPHGQQDRRQQLPGTR